MKALAHILRLPFRWPRSAKPLVVDTKPGAGSAVYFFDGQRASAAAERPPTDRVASASDSRAKERLAVIAAGEARFRSLTLLGSDWHWDQDIQHRFTAINGSITDPIGATIAQHLGRSLWQMPHIAPLQGDWSAYRRALKAQEVFRDLVLRAPQPDGGFSFVSISGEPVLDENGEFIGYRGVGLDITKQKLIEANINRLARFDSLTGLHNRGAFYARLDHAIALARRHDRAVALLFVDLDRFKDVNDAFGHLPGDEVLEALARRLTKAVRDTDTVARLGGDEFIVLAEEVTNQVDVNEFGQAPASDIVRAGRPARQECRLGASIGLRCFPTTAKTRRRYSRRPTAMYRAKESGGNNLAFAAEAQGRRRPSAWSWARLRRAVELSQFQLLYQPKVAIRTGMLTGVEALVRWQHPEHGRDAGRLHPDRRGVGPHPPDRALGPEPRAHRACGGAPSCPSDSRRREPLRPPIHRRGPRHRSRARFGADRVAARSPRARDYREHDGATGRPETLLEIREMGVHLSIDDFGTGYSSPPGSRSFRSEA